MPTVLYISTSVLLFVSIIKEQCEEFLERDHNPASLDPILQLSLMSVESAVHSLDFIRILAKSNVILLHKSKPL